VLSFLPPTALLAVSYFWGYVFYQAHLSELGLDSGLFPQSTPEVYIQTVMAVLAVISRPMQWLAHVFASWAVVLAAVMVVLILLAAWLSTRRPIRQWWHRFRIRRRLQSGPDDDPLFLRRASRWSLIACLVILGPIFAVTAIALAGLAMIAPPLFAGKAQAHDELSRKAYETWPRVSWVGEGGKTNVAHLVRCSDRWCGVILDGQAVAIPSSLVKRIDASVSDVTAGH
jgi:hypothetical protein